MTFPSWRYGPDGEAAIFDDEDDVPAGWVDHPSKVKGGDKAAYVEADPLDHDGDGSPGGSPAGYYATATKGARNRKAKGARKSVSRDRPQ